MNPVADGFKIDDLMLPAQAFTRSEMNDIFYRLRTDESASMLLESCDPEEADLRMNPGQDLVLEAVTAVFSRLDKTMKALSRVFNRYANTVQAEGDPFVGPNRKNNLFAYKTVTFTFSDEQTVSILFHSPGRDPLKFVSDDTLIAYRWMLNRRDITAIVSPENGRDINLQTMAKRIVQLVEENSQKFQERNAERKEEAGRLEQLQTEETQTNEKVDLFTQENADLSQQIESAEERIARLKEQVEARDAGMEGGDGRDRSKGSKYDKSMTMNDIAKAIRKDIADTLPTGFKVSVRQNNSTLSGAIRAEITAIPQGQQLLSDEYLAHLKESGESAAFNSQRYSPEVAKALEDIKRIANQYNYDNSDSMTDYSDVNFYFNVSVDYDLESDRKKTEIEQTQAQNGDEGDDNPADANGESESEEQDAGGAVSKNSDVYEPYYKEAVEKGLSPLSPSEFMEEINSGERNGFSLDEIKQELARYRQMLIDLRAKKITPRRVAGVGASQKDAVKWIEREIEQAEQDISTGGTGNHVNARNYRRYLRDLIRGSEDEAKKERSNPASNQQFNFSAVIRDAEGNPYHVNSRRGFNADVAPFINGKPEIHSGNPTVDLGNYTFADEWWDADSKQIVVRSETQGDPEPHQEEQTPAENAQPASLADLDAAFAGRVARSLKNIADIDNGEKGMNRALFASNLTNKIKTRAKRGEIEIADAALRMIAEFNAKAKKPAVTPRNSVWKVTGKSYSDYADAGTPEKQSEQDNPAAKVDAAYKFDASDEFKKNMAQYVNAGEDYNPFETAKQADTEAAKHGAKTVWSVESDGDYTGKVIKDGQEVASIDLGIDGKALGFLPDGSRISMTSQGFNGVENTYPVTDPGSMIKMLFTDPANGLARPRSDEKPGNSSDPGEQNVNDVEAISQKLEQLLTDTDSAKVDQALDELAERAETAGVMDDLDEQLNKVADYLTELMSKEAANVA